ncbi:Trafficking protein particle complex subunit 8 [Chionoecetes opilio]|uniref:Trafficking protein particle complex subunit 8 n=1 Tax=Chionoecetes opilio TaxID=41210 RepID=A0A8J5BTH8_CHIOP|nr:Trafficking protein particle complex subunit 8 [Chionoecetes opilio]
MIEVKGPRLNNTNTEKFGAVYASDKRLDITVLPPMSRLSVSFHDIPQIMSCGEVCSTDAVITNIGPCPISKLKLAVSDPSHVYMETKAASLPKKHVCVLSEEETADSKIINRITLLTLENGSLNSGESIQAKLWLHAPLSPGAFDVELLFYYESTGLVGKKKYRLLRHHSCIYLERSLSLKVSSTVSQNLQESLKEAEDVPGSCSYTTNLLVEVINNSEVDSTCSSYTIAGLSCNSKNWAAVPHSSLQGQTLKVGPWPGESCHLCVKCVQHLNAAPNRLVLSQLLFNDLQDPLNSWWRFSLRERITVRDLLADPLPPNPAADHTPPPPKQDQLDAAHILACNTLDMVVTAVWKGERGGREIWGQHSIHLMCVGDSISFPVSSLVQAGEEEKPPVRIIPETPLQLTPAAIPPASKQKHMVKVSAHFPDSMDHDFVTNRLCCLEFELYLHNCSACHLNTFLNLAPEGLPGSTAGLSSQMYTPQASTQLLYVGGTVRKVCLSPWGSSKVPVRVMITSPGTYSLGVISLTSLRVNASQDKSEQPIPQICQLQTAVTVRQTLRPHGSHNT